MVSTEVKRIIPSWTPVDLRGKWRAVTVHECDAAGHVVTLQPMLKVQNIAFAVGALNPTNSVSMIGIVGVNPGCQY